MHSHCIYILSNYFIKTSLYLVFRNIFNTFILILASAEFFAYCNFTNAILAKNELFGILSFYIELLYSSANFKFYD